MPRAKVQPQNRQRVAQACDSCKRRKEKCNGVVPCQQCVSRKCAATCRYTSHGPLALPEVIHQGNGDSEVQVAFTPLGEILVPTKVHDEFTTSAPIPKDSRMLKDGKGKFIYVGESASLSFLQTVRSAVTAAVGPCRFTSDPLHHSMTEIQSSIHFETTQEVMIDLETAFSLTGHFFLATSGSLDLFDPSWLTCQLPSWANQPSSRTKPQSAIIYLSLAIGAQGRGKDESDELLAEQCCAYGRQLATIALMDDPSLATVQAFTLMAYYMIAACRRNAAFTNLGVAVRAAYTLGIHLHETNTAFVRTEGILRERAWKSLRVLDLFLSASMGRPPGTSEAVSSIPWASIESNVDRENSGVTSQAFSAIFRICHIFERILVEVYSKKAVSLELAREISRQHRQWTEELPRALKIDGLEESNAPQSPGISLRLGSSIVTMAYYYSIVLLTRPFLSYQLRHTSERRSRDFEISPVKADLIAYADACVDSAIKGIDVAHEYAFERNTPKRQPLVVNSVFISALCLGLAYMSDYDQQRWPLERSLDRAIAILSHLAQSNPQSVRHAEVCRLLKEAVLKYAEKRDGELLQSNSSSVRNLFGDVRASVESRSINQDQSSLTHATRRSGSSGFPGEMGVDSMSSPSFESNMLHNDSMISMSGQFRTQLPVAHRYYCQDTSDIDLVQQQFLNSDVTSSQNGYSFDHDVPLFSLTSDLTGNAYFWQ